jgi:hypothetical protein
MQPKMGKMDIDYQVYMFFKFAALTWFYVYPFVPTNTF